MRTRPNEVVVETEEIEETIVSTTDLAVEAGVVFAGGLLRRV
ncbi:MAG: hypothetical protein Q7J48_08335 [Nocardioides sp.]|nr:hypothetical protein [Nocardioides sp.]